LVSENWLFINYFVSWLYQLGLESTSLTKLITVGLIITILFQIILYLSTSILLFTLIKFLSPPLVRSIVCDCRIPILRIFLLKIRRKQKVIWHLQMNLRNIKNSIIYQEVSKFMVAVLGVSLVLLPKQFCFLQVIHQSNYSNDDQTLYG
jgi:hypothetical protein